MTHPVLALLNGHATIFDAYLTGKFIVSPLSCTSTSARGQASAMSRARSMWSIPYLSCMPCLAFFGLLRNYANDLVYSYIQHNNNSLYAHVRSSSLSLRLENFQLGNSSYVTSKASRLPLVGSLFSLSVFTCLDP